MGYFLQTPGPPSGDLADLNRLARLAMIAFIADTEQDVAKGKGDIHATVNTFTGTVRVTDGVVTLSYPFSLLLSLQQPGQ